MRRLESTQDVEKFRTLIHTRLGLQFEDAKLNFLGEVIQLRMDETGLSSADYLRALEFDASDTELAPLAKELTVPETYFFRNADQFRAFREVVLPARMKAQAATRRLNILSAGCASGEEAYSLAMTLLGAGLDPSWSFAVRAIDINPTALKKARRGRYSSWAFRETPQDQQQRWFKQEGRDLIVADRVREYVTFQECNLASENADVWRPGTYDVIFCRNVLMYFSPAQAAKVIARISRALAPQGYFFLGHAETLRGLSDDFHLHHTHGAFYYERKDGDGHTAPRALPAAASSAPTGTWSQPDSSDDDWYHSINRASERVYALSTEGAKPDTTRLAPKPAPKLQPSTPDMAPVFALLHGDRFSDALAYVRDMPKGSNDDPDVLLVEAMLLAHNRKTSEAEAVCQRLLQIDEFNASAHHVLALCREAAGDMEAAMEHDRIAAYLDPTFAMPHLHMGLLGRRAGNRDVARRELAHALTLLKHEDGARLMLFGGGFNRQSMIELCATALRDCGGAP